MNHFESVIESVLMRAGPMENRNQTIKDLVAALAATQPASSAACRYPLCQPEEKQQEIAADVHAQPTTLFQDTVHLDAEQYSAQVARMAEDGAFDHLSEVQAQPVASDESDIQAMMQAACFSCASCGFPEKSHGCNCSPLAATQPAVAPAAPVAENLHSDIQHDMGYVAGLKAGWNLGVAGDQAALNCKIEAAQELLRAARRELNGTTVPAQGEREAIPTWREHYDALCKITTTPPNDLIAERRKSACRDREIRELRAALAAQVQPVAPDGWIAGSPAHPYDQEWFIAETTYGDRVVLKALPKEFTYDFKTADETYIKRDKIKRWMQFLDSEYISAAAPAPAQQDKQAGDVVRDAAYLKALAMPDGPDVVGPAFPDSPQQPDGAGGA